MGIEETKETWARVDLFCDGLGELGDCAAWGVDDPAEDMPMVTDCCSDPEDARRLALHRATDLGWQFEINLKRWLCPDCVRAQRA